MVVGLLLSAGCESPDHVLNLGQRSDPIRNGTREPQTVQLTPGQVLAIGWLHSAGRPWQNFCTGTLIAPRVVATARHCIDGRQQGNIGFGVGLLPTQPLASFEVISARPHPEQDAALLFLAEDAVERTPELEPIPMNRAPLDPSLIGQEVEAAGYGETYDRSRSGRYFAAVELSAITPSEVIVDGRGEQGICFGDSGGPVMMEIEPGRLVVLGVESWGDPSCVGVDHLTRLDVLSEWVDSTSADALRPPDPECADIPDEGVCTDGVLTMCADGRFLEEDCGEDGLECRRRGPSGPYGCLERDVCAEVGPLGVCDGDSVVRCRFGDLITDDCATRDLVCATDSSGAFCTEEAVDVPEPAEDAALGETEADLGVLADQGSPDESDGGVTEADPESGDEGRAANQGCSAVFDESAAGIPWRLTLGMLLVMFCRRRWWNGLG